jgi:hypothetical protein
MTTVKVTRKELYDQVWAMPMSTLAARYGVSDVALAKTCRRMNVPRPGRGYWARIAAHVKVERPVLPPNDSKTSSIFLNRVENPVPKALAPAAPLVRVAETLHGAHEVVHRLARLLQRAKPDSFGRLVVHGGADPVLAVTVAAHRRALLIVDGLSRAATERGHAVACQRAKTVDGTVATLALSVAGTDFDVSVVERLDRRERERAPEEDRRASSTTARDRRSSTPAHEQFSSGRLQLVVRNLSGTRGSWSDGVRPLERYLGRIVVVLETEAERRRVRRELDERERVEAERRRCDQEAEAERRRLEAVAEARRAAELEARRRHELELARDLKGLVRTWRTANDIRAFVRAVEAAVPVTDRGATFTAWLRWAEDHAEKVDPLNEPYQIAIPVEPDTVDDAREANGDRDDR